MGDRHRGPIVELISAILIAAILCLLMIMPYLPGRFDASAATVSFAAQVGGFVSLPLVPVGLAWMFGRRHGQLWRRLALALVGVVALVIAIAAMMNQLTFGVLLGVVAVGLVRTVHRLSQASSDHADQPSNAIPRALVLVPLIGVAFRTAALPRAADWSRDRAIRQSASLIERIESFRDRRGHYPVSLHSLNCDFSTGVMGVERFYYEPNGDAYNVFFVRPHLELDAMEVVLYNPRGEHRFTSHVLDILQYDGEQLDLRRGDRRRTRLAHPHWVSILFD